MKINRESDALIIVDLQPDFMPGGALPVEGGHEIMPEIAQLAPEFDTVIATQDWHPPHHISFASVHKKKPFEIVELYGKEHMLWPDHCVAGTNGASLAMYDSLINRLSMILRKGMSWRVDSYSAFKENWGPDGKRHETGLAGFLYARHIRGVVIVGLAREVCCLATAQDAAVGFDTRVVWGLTRAVYPNKEDETRKLYLEAGVKIE